MENTAAFTESNLSPFCKWLERTTDQLHLRSHDDSMAASIPFRQIVDMLPQCIFWKDIHGVFLGCNIAGAKALGMAHPDQIRGMTDADIHEDAERAHYLRVEDEKVIHGGIPIYRVLSHDRGPPEAAHWYETSKIPLRNGDHVIVGLLICYEDVTARVRSEEALRKTNEHLDVAANFMHNWSMWIDQHGKLRWVSPAVETLVGYSAEECYAMPDYPLSIIHPEDRGRLKAIFEIGTDEAETQFRFIRKDGRHRWGSIAKRVVPDKNGHPNGIFSTIIDITALKEAEEQLIELNTSLEQRIEAATEEAATNERLMLQQSRHAGMGEMIGHIAHQWRQPLTALGLLLQNVDLDARDKLLDADELSQKVQQAFHLVATMSSTIDDFRNFFQPVAHDVSFNIHDCVQGVLRLLDASLNFAEISVTVDAPGPCEILGRPNEMAQVLLNLLSNAKDALVFYRPDKRQIRISIGAENGMAVIREHNNGDFISAKHIDRIFDPYYTTKEDGTGLGLYMCKQIINQHFNGEIGVANTEDGVEFVLRVPLASKGCAGSSE